MQIKKKKCLKLSVVIMICFISFLFSGCTQKNAKKNTNSMANTNGLLNESAVSWQSDYFRLERKYDLAIKSNDIFGCYVVDGIAQIDVLNGNDYSWKMTYKLTNASSITGMAADQKGRVFLLGLGDNKWGLWKIVEGCPLEFEELDLPGINIDQDLYFKGIYVNQDEELFIWCKMLIPETEELGGKETIIYHWEDRVYVTDQEMNTLFYEMIKDINGTETINFQIGKNDTPFFLVKDAKGAYLQEIDVKQKKLKELQRLKESEEVFKYNFDNELQNIFCVDDGILYCQNDGLYEYNFANQKSQKIIDLSTYGIFSSNILYINKNQEMIEIIDNQEDADYSEYILLCRGEDNKKIVTLGSIIMVSDLENIVTEFNRSNKEYRVEVIDYLDYAESYTEAMERLKLDVITGNAPDIITIGGMDYSMFSQKGVLADLYAFMQNDKDLSKDMLIQSVIKAYEEDGHLYSIAPAFQLHSIWGYNDIIHGRKKVTFNELSELLERAGKDINAIAGFSADESILTRLCTVCMDEFVDWEKGTCHFNGEYFKEVMMFAKKYKGSYSNESYAERIRNKEIVMSVGILASVADYQIQEELYEGRMEVIGYPTENGSGTAVAYRGSDIAINAMNDDNKGAWEFVKYYLLHGYKGQGFPIVKQQFDIIMQEAMTEDYDTMEDGSVERIPKDSYYNGSDWSEIYAASQKEVDAVKSLVNEVKYKFEPHAEIQRIINEEASAYFLDQISLENTVEKIQNRVTLLLQESQY